MLFNANKAIKYVVLPGIFPRLKTLVFSGFSALPYLVAMMLLMVRLLPTHHPCFKAAHRKEWGMLRILAEAARKIEFKWQNSDQIIVFGAILGACVMMTLYMAGAVFFVMTGVAMALPSLTGLFDTLNPENDVAFMMLDRTFGLPGVFESIIETDTATYGPFPNVFHLALQSLFEFFSNALFLVMIFIFLYHVIEMVREVSMTGKAAPAMSDDVVAPYSDHPEKGFAWLPLRFIVAFGLLLPISDGLNSAQWITLYTAKFGSGLATNAWIEFNDKTGTSPTEDGDNPTGNTNEHLVAFPTPPDASGLISQLMLIKACVMMHAYGIQMTDGNVSDGTNGPYDVKGFVVNGGYRRPLTSTGTPTDYADAFMATSADYDATPSGVANVTAGDTFVDILQYSDLGDIQIVYGYFNEGAPERYKKFPGGVLPVCGSVKIPVTSRTGEGLFAAEAYLFGTLYVVEDALRPSMGALDPYEDNSSLAVVREFFLKSHDFKRFMNRVVTDGTWTGNRNCMADENNDGYESTDDNDGDLLGLCEKSIPVAYWKDLIDDYYQYAFEMASYAAYDYLANTAICTDTASGGNPDYCIGDTAYDTIGVANPMNMTQNGVDILDYGWGGAGLWYNKISEHNGALYTAVNSLPMIEKYPLVMEKIREERQKNDREASGGACEQFNPRKSGTTSSNNANEQNQFSNETAVALHVLCTQIAENENIKVDWLSNSQRYSNPVEAAMAAAFSQMKVINAASNETVEPMVFLTGVGRALVDKAVVSLITATSTALAGGLIHIADSGTKGGQLMGQAFGAFSETAMAIAMISLSTGVMLAYVLPLMPFMYFFFAVGRWLKTIFEAMVGVPLWAMAHMRTHGAGLPGDAASTGYFLLLEIFIRPIVTVFSLVIAFGAFSALVAVLNGVFTMAVDNILGVDMNMIDPFDDSGAAQAVDADLIQTARGIVDQFFLSIMYIVIVYMIGISCFKLIDLIPDNIMRWSGAGISTFGKSDISDDQLDKLRVQLPVMTQHFVGEVGGLIKGALYEPLAGMGQAKYVEAEKKAAEKAAAEQAQKKAAEQKKAADKKSEPPSGSP